MKIVIFFYVLWSSMYIDLSDGNLNVTIELGICQEGEFKIAKFSCTDKCDVKSATASFSDDGNIKIIGRYGKRVSQTLICKRRKCFCEGSTENQGSATCTKIEGYQPKKRSIGYFVLKCERLTKDLRIIVSGNIKPTTTKPTAKITPTPNVCNCNGDWMTGNCGSNGECECKTGHEGGNCDQCIDGYYKQGNGSCNDCNCNGDWMTGNCGSNGECECKTGHAGGNCDRCMDGYYKQGNGSCKNCNCNSKWMTGNCDSHGVCTCIPDRIGGNCDQCIFGYFDPGDGSCKVCNCNDKKMTGSCRGNGECICRIQFKGSNCDQCNHGYYEAWKGTCIRCSNNCNGFGMNGHCYSRWDCQCHYRFYKYKDECKRCNCFYSGMTGDCRDDDGKCYCKPGHFGDHCQFCCPNQEMNVVCPPSIDVRVPNNCSLAM